MAAKKKKLTAKQKKQRKYVLAGIFGVGLLSFIGYKQGWFSKALTDQDHSEKPPTIDYGPLPETNEGRISAISYITPAWSGTLSDPTINTNKIRVRYKTFIGAKIGDIVSLSGTKYDKRYYIEDVWKTSDGSGWVELNTPWKDTGIVNDNGIPIDRTGGTIKKFGL